MPRLVRRLYARDGCVGNVNDSFYSFKLSYGDILMEQTNSRAETGGSAPPRKRFSLIDVLEIIVSWRKFIVSTFVVVTGLSAVTSFVLPKWYTSQTVILPPRSKGFMTGLSAISPLQREIPALRALTGATSSEDAYRYLAILKSRRALEKVVMKFNLIQVFGVKEGSVAKAADALEDNVTFKLGEEGTISITVYDRDAERAAAMANYFVDVINEIGTDLNVQEGRSNREFLEKRVRQNQEDLRVAEERLSTFQKEKGFVAVPQETQSSISAVAQLYANKTLMEIQLGIAEKRYGEEHPLVKASKTELASINAKLQTIPDLGVEYFRLYREFAIQEKIYELIVPLYEQAKYEEKRDVSSAVVLDAARVPEEPAQPKKRLIVLIFAFISLVSSISVALFVEGLKRLKTSRPGEYLRLENMWAELRAAFRLKKSV